jgi:hypothetical protein
MESSERKGRDTSNRILLAAIVIVVVAPLLLKFGEGLIDGKIAPMPQILIGVTALLALIADRIYLYLRSRQKKNESTS